MNIRIIVLGAAIAAGGVATTLAASNITHAASGQSGAGNVIRETRGENANARLNQAERDATITAAQKTAFKTEIKTLRTERKSVISKGSTKEQRQAERTKLKGELQAWANTNNFPLAKLFPKLAQ